MRQDFSHEAPHPKMKPTQSTSHTKTRANSPAGRNPPTGARQATKPQRGDSHRVSGATPKSQRGESIGYDADSGPTETGLASKYASLASEAEAEAVAEPGLSLPPEDLGSRSLMGALQGPAQPSGFEPRATLESEEDSLTPVSLDASADDESGEDMVSPREPHQIDLTQDVIYEGSLFDQPRDEGGTYHASVRANEVDATLERNARAARSRKGRHHR